MFQYREMRLEESTKIRQIDATCYIENAWRMNHEAGEYELIKIDWTDFELPNGFEWHLERFEKTLQSGGKAFGCFDDDTLAGYATLDAGVFGREEKYVLLDQMFVSKDYRGKGIGKELISLCSRQALRFGAEKIYLCAGSSEDTIAFYCKLGCKPASERNDELFQEDPNDIQLELKCSENKCCS